MSPLVVRSFKLKRTSPFDPTSFSADPDEDIKMTVTSIAIPNQATFGSHSSGATWRTVGTDTAMRKVREFTMPATNTRYNMNYAFGPGGPAAARYEVLFEGKGGATDHSTVHPDFDPFVIPYTFIVAGPMMAATKKATKKAAKKAAKKASKNAAPKNAVNS